MAGENHRRSPPSALAGLAPILLAPPMARSSPLHPAHADLDSIVVSETAIKRRIRRLGQEIGDAYGEEEITMIAIINGAILFTADLIRAIPNPIRLDCIRISSYRNETKSIGKPQLVHSLTLDVTNRHVLLLDDILDTGKTLAMVVDVIRKLNPASIKTCVLLDKKGRREVPFDADFAGFEIPDKFVVGYGLDFAERFRNLPCIGVLKPHLQNPPEWA